jgi:ABC-type transport system involved in multi-copper enzyme maturation permease subunit
MPGVRSLGTVARLVRADLVKLSRYWVILAGYGAIAGIALPGAVLAYHAEQAIRVTSGSGYTFAISLMSRFLDLAAPILFVMMCILFALDVSHAAIKYILTRPVTRLQLLISKYVTAAIMVAASLALLWTISLGAGWYYYGLGDLTENEYLLFEGGYVLRQIALASLFIFVAHLAVASLAICVSAYSSTMGGAIIIGLILFLFFDAMALVPASLGFRFELGGQERLLPWMLLGFPSQIYVPMYLLDDLPTGVPIQSWWSGDVRRMLGVCGGFALLFFTLAALGVRKRDFAL